MARADPPWLTGLYIVGAIIFLPAIVIAAPFWLIYKVLHTYYGSPTAIARKARSETEQLYQQAQQIVTRLPSVSDLNKQVFQSLRDNRDRLPPRSVCLAFLNISEALYEAEGFQLESIPVPPLPESIEGARYRDRLTAYISKLQNPEAFSIFRGTLIQSFKGFLEKFPDAHLVTSEDMVKKSASEHLSIPIADILSTGNDAIEELILPFYASSASEFGLFSNLREQLDRNACQVSDLPFDARNRTSPKLILPSKFDGTPSEAARLYLKNTPLSEVFNATVPFAIPEPARFEHHWIVAPQGAGKTQTLQYLILNDILKVASSQASLVVMDSQGDLIRNISALKLFAPGEPLSDKLLIIEPDPDYPLAINPFDLHIAGSARERERLTNTALELLTYVFGSLLAAEMTPKQETLFRYIIRALMGIPGATILTFADFLTGKEAKYQDHIDQLEGPARQFFETQFNDKQFVQTKQEVAWRLMYMLENTTFARMFASPKNKLNLFEELNSPKIILINTDRELLKERTELFGRLFIAMLLQAAEQRASLDRTKRLPVYCYIDECHDYIARDTKITTILDQARKMNIGMILANQRLSQITSPNVLDALMNVSIKFARAVNDSDAHALARNMQASAEFLTNQPDRTFAASVRGTTKQALSIQVPFFLMEKLDKMTVDEREQMQKRMRERYAIAYRKVHPPQRPVAAPAEHSPADGGIPKEWG